MLYTLYSLADFNIFQYITVRATIGFFIAFLTTLFLLPKFIKWAKNRGVHQPIYDLAPQAHQAKSSTPTMGGMVFLTATVIASLFTIDFTNYFALGALLVLVLFGAIGVKDDYSKITNGKNNDGMSARTKFLLQLLSGSIVVVFLLINGFNTELYIPFYKEMVLDHTILMAIFWVVLMAATSNAVNLTDGLDGLATVPSIFAISTLSIFLYITGHAILSGYLLLPKIIGVGEVVIIAASLAGALVGFLWFNCHPAQVFMGDSGSLSTGAFIAYLAILAKSEFLLILVGFVFVLETVSVILQVGSFKARKKRIFLMAPIHHHFEMKGWSENKIIVRFWIIAFMMNVVALLTLKIR